MVISRSPYGAVYGTGGWGDATGMRRTDLAVLARLVRTDRRAQS